MSTSDIAEHQAQLRLEIPASPRFLAAVRLVAASAGADAGLSVDDLDDLRLGVDELVAVMIERAAEGSRIELDLAVSAEQITVSGRIDGDVRPDPAPLDELTERIVAAVADSYELAARSFRIDKSAVHRAR